MQRRIATILLVQAIAAVTGAISADDRVDAVFDIWKKRQADVHSVRFEWDEKITVYKGSLSAFPHVGLPNPILIGKVLPPKDMHFTRKCRLLFDEGRCLYRFDGLNWDNNSGKFRKGMHGMYYDEAQTVTLDNPATQLITSLDGKIVVDDPFPRAWLILKANSQGFLNLDKLFSVAWTYRFPTTFLTGFQQRDFKFSKIDVLDDGQECVVLAWNRPLFNRPGNSYLIWVTHDERAAIRRHQRIHEGEETLLIDFQYRLQPDGLLIPDKWSIVRSPDGRLQEKLNAKVTRCELNADLSMEDLRLEFPVGTLVIDNTAPDERIEYLVKSGGEERYIEPEERGIRHSILMATDSGEAVKKSTEK